MWWRWKEKKKMSKGAEISVDHDQVVKILSNDVIFCNNWPLMCQVLEFSESTKQDLERMNYNYCSIMDIITTILKHWKISFPNNANLTNLSEKLREIGCIKSGEEIEHLRMSTESETKLIWHNFRSPTTIYKGRENEMKEIDEQWKKCAETRLMQFVAVTGLEGIGKSELAISYAKEFQDKEKGHCIWIDAGTNQTLSQSFHDLAENHLNLSLKDHSGKEKSLEDLLVEIYELLSNEKCLIVFDNVETYENKTLRLLSDLSEKHSPEILRPFVIIISRLTNAKKFFGIGNKCTEIELDVLLSEPAFGFFSRTFNLNEDLTNDKALVLKVLIQKLCERLQYYPLAMHQAAAYIKENLGSKSNNCDLGKEIPNYFNEIDKETRKMMDQNSFQYESMEQISKITWKVSLNKISKTSEIGKSAVKMMNILSFFYPENISPEILSKIFEKMKSPIKKWVSLGFRKANLPVKDFQNSKMCLLLLRDYAIIKLSDNKVSIHRLVQEIIRDGNKERKKSNDHLHRLLTGMKEMFESGEIPIDQIIHSKTIWEHANQNGELIKKHGEFPKLIYRKLTESGKYRDAFDFSCRALTVLETTFGEDSPKVLDMKSRKGRALEKLGQYSESLALLTEVYEKQKEFFGEESEHCLTTANQIGDVHWRLDDFEQANKWYEKVQKRGRANSKKYKEFPAVQESVSGTAESAMLVSKHNLACVKFEEKDYGDALSTFSEVLEVQERTLELDHPNTLSTKSWLSLTHKYLGNIEESRKLAKEVHEKRIKILGHNHPDTIHSKNLLDSLESLDKPSS